MRYRLAITFLLALALIGLTGVSAQPASVPERESPRALHVTQATDVIEHWEARQHLYVKGNLGVGEAQLADLEQWLDDNAPNWTVVLVESADGERYTDAAGQSYRDMDAVEHALGQGLPNRTAFGKLVDPRTQEANGAFFVLFLKERKFSYFGSAAQDSRGLGEDRWQGNLDKPAIAAMRSGGRIVDAAKDTITNIDNRLSSSIAAEANQRAREAAERKRREAAEKAALAAARERAESQLHGAVQALDLLEKETAKLRQANPNLTGDLVRPDWEKWRVELKAAEAAVEGGNSAAASPVAAQATSWAESRLKILAEYRTAPEKVKDLTARYENLTGQALSDSARRELNSAHEALEGARDALERGDGAFVNALTTAQSMLLAAENKIAAQEIAAVTAQRNRILLGAGLLLLLIAAGGILNWRRRGSMAECLALLQAWEKALGEKSAALVNLMDRSFLLLGISVEEMAGRYRGETRRLGEQVIQDVDEMFIMSSCANRILVEAKAKAVPSGFGARIINFFAASPYRAAIRLLRNHPIVFNPEEGLERIVRGARTKREQLLGDLASYQPFTMSFNQLIESFNERAERALSDLDTIESSVVSVEKDLEEIQTTIDSVRAREDEIAGLEESDSLLRLRGVFSDLIPAAQAVQMEATQIALYDAVGALRHQGAEARQKAGDAQALVDAVSEFRRRALLKIVEDEQGLSSAGLATQWIDDELADASDEIERLVEQAMKAAAAPEIQILRENLERFRKRVASAVELDRACREVAQKTIDETASIIETARRELGTALNQPPDRVLREPELDPSQRVQSSLAQITVVRTALDRGDVAAARNALDAVDRLTREAREIVAATQTAFKENEDLAAACQHETESIEALLPEHEQILSDIEQNYAASVLALGAGDPTHPNANGTIADNLVETRDHLASAQTLWRQANEMFGKAEILQAAETLRQVQARQQTARFRLEEIKEKKARLTATDADNKQRFNQLATRKDEVAAEVDDHKTMAPTKEEFEKAARLLTEAQNLIETSRRDPFQAEQALTTATEGFDAVGEMIRCDRDLYAQAETSLRSAEGQLRSAQSLSREAETDRIGDSVEITRAVDATDRLAAALADIRRQFDQPHNDWRIIDREADRISAEAGRQAAVIRNELNAAESAVSAISRAADAVRNAGGWAGAFGVRILGCPGSDYLSRARELLQSGDYSRAQFAAETARRTAEQSIAEAEARVRRRRREEEQRREEARRRRREEERRRALSMTFSSQGGSHFGGGTSRFSSGSGARRSSFSSGSGVSRSGW